MMLISIFVKKFFFLLWYSFLLYISYLINFLLALSLAYLIKNYISLSSCTCKDWFNSETFILISMSTILLIVICNCFLKPSNVLCYLVCTFLLIFLLHSNSFHLFLFIDHYTLARLITLLCSCYSKYMYIICMLF